VCVCDVMCFYCNVVPLLACLVARAGGESAQLYAGACACMRACVRLCVYVCLCAQLPFVFSGQADSDLLVPPPKQADSETRGRAHE
jgi:hypothetical protein